MRTRLVLACLFAASVSPSSATDLQQQLRECSRIEDSVKRIACFDALPAVPSAPTSTGTWKVNTEISKIDDSTNVTIFTKSLGQIEGRFGESGYITLGIRCRENTTDLYFHFAGQFMSDYGGGEITYRIDKEPAKTKKFGESNNHEALGLWSGSEAIPFIKSLFGAHRLFVQATPYGENAVGGEFIVTGLENAVKPLRQAFGWSENASDRSSTVSPSQDSSTSAAAASVGGTYVVQVGSKHTQADALASYTDMQQRYPTLLAKYRPMVQKADLGAKGVWYRLRIGPIAEKVTAMRLCSQLISLGLPDCLVMTR